MSGDSMNFSDAEMQSVSSDATKENLREYLLNDKFSIAKTVIAFENVMKKYDETAKDVIVKSKKRKFDKVCKYSFFISHSQKVYFQSIKNYNEPKPVQNTNQNKILFLNQKFEN